MELLEQVVAKKLLQMKTFSVQPNSPLLWSNGWHSPIYFDDRKLLSYPYARNFIKLELARFASELYPDADVIAGVATNGIALSTLVAEELGLPLIYVYPTPKNHALENQIEGELRPHQKVVIIENQVNTGAAVSKVIEAIRDNGCTVEGIITIFNYMLQSGVRRLKMADVDVASLTDFQILMQVAERDNWWKKEDLSILREWHRSPAKYLK